MSHLDIDKFYVSHPDRLFHEFDATHEKTASQLQEIKKYQRIFELRDNPKANLPSDNELWDLE